MMFKIATVNALVALIICSMVSDSASQPRGSPLAAGLGIRGYRNLQKDGGMEAGDMGVDEAPVDGGMQGGMGEPAAGAEEALAAMVNATNATMADMGNATEMVEEILLAEEVPANPIADDAADEVDAKAEAKDDKRKKEN